ncbi:Protein of unknown function [Flavobacterium micromati]|jgi:hypothetical protein|uniref:DUF2442 domain-containing protein n=1 Tax=Flavobacterium micromati TaxID=229205 RepID=A0A1M5JF79_9FLAO|nr:DUF2442 domain-containing protein [Flavobacterium micromati]SHG39246.1 Protein of unknown function [Flavobacterium micromati]
MIIAINYSDESERATINVIEAIYIKSYIIKVIFDDESERIINFEHFLKKSQHPSISKYLNLHNFKNFNIVDGNLNWNDYDMIFPVWDLYLGDIT